MSSLILRGFAASFICCSIPVSYTHLDVYKRQPLSRPAGYHKGALIAVFKVVIGECILGGTAGGGREGLALTFRKFKGLGKEGSILSAVAEVGEDYGVVALEGKLGRADVGHNGGVFGALICEVDYPCLLYTSKAVQAYFRAGF